LFAPATPNFDHDLPATRNSKNPGSNLTDANLGGGSQGPGLLIDMAVQNIEGPSKSFLTKEQWAWSLFDAGCWGYASVTVSTIIPLVVRQPTSNNHRINDESMTNQCVSKKFHASMTIITRIG
jgi:hypothetical protein